MKKIKTKKRKTVSHSDHGHKQGAGTKMMGETATTSRTIDDELLWYCSYGSNLSRSRFMTYISGGRAAGSKVVHEGCRDITPPLDDRPFLLPYALSFPLWSNWWGGGAAAIDVSRPTVGCGSSPTESVIAHEPARGRKYLIRRQQFIDIVAQENGITTAYVEERLDLDRVKREKAVRLLENHAYGTLVWLGECEEGHPIFTFTLHPEAITDTYKASPPYLEKLALGLCEAHELSMEGAAEYLLRLDGVRQHYTRESLLSAIIVATSDDDATHGLLVDA